MLWAASQKAPLSKPLTGCKIGYVAIAAVLVEFGDLVQRAVAAPALEETRVKERIIALLVIFAKVGLLQPGAYVS